MLCRRRAASGYVYEAENLTKEANGIGFPFLLEMMRARVAGNDLSDTERHIATALYIGMYLGHKKTSSGLPLTAPATETDITL